MAGAGVGHSGGREQCSTAQGGDGLALLVEGRGFDLLLCPAGQVHLHSDTLLLSPEQEEVIGWDRSQTHRTSCSNNKGQNNNGMIAKQQNQVKNTGIVTLQGARKIDFFIQNFF